MPVNSPRDRELVFQKNRHHIGKLTLTEYGKAMHGSSREKRRYTAGCCHSPALLSQTVISVRAWSITGWRLKAIAGSAMAIHLTHRETLSVRVPSYRSAPPSVEADLSIRPTRNGRASGSPERSTRAEPITGTSINKPLSGRPLRLRTMRFCTTRVALRLAHSGSLM